MNTADNMKRILFKKTSPYELKIRPNRLIVKVGDNGILIEFFSPEILNLAKN